MKLVLDCFRYGDRVFARTALTRINHASISRNTYTNMTRTTYVGIADAHGIESLLEKQHTTNFERRCQIMRAGANRQRHAVYFEADMDKGAFKIINGCLNDDNFALALEWLKRLSLELRSLPEHEASWKLIPNPDIDPYS